jgi:uncharacterized membrane protein
MIRKVFTRIIQYILNGLLLTLPFVITGYVVYRLFQLLDGLLPIEHRYPGMGILLLLSFLALFGWLGSKFINETIRFWFNKVLDRIPLIKTIYKSVTDLLGAFVGQKKSFNRPVLVKLSKENDIEVIGFITDDDLKEWGNIKNKIGVYLPMSYSFSGHFVIVPIENVQVINKSSVEVMKYIVSGGVVDLENESNE